MSSRKIRMLCRVESVLRSMAWILVARGPLGGVQFLLLEALTMIE